MGCDIHMLFEKREVADAPWRLFVPVVHCPMHSGTDSYCWFCDEAGNANYGGRNYHLFSILGNVRNASRPAAFRFISEHRGIPEDACPQLRAIANEEDFGEHYLGDHSQTHASLKELLEFDWEQQNTLSGIISAEQFIRWDGREPDSYCGGIGGPDIRVVDYPHMPPLRNLDSWLERQGNPSHVRVSWRVTYREAVGEVIFALIEALKANGEPGNVRMVFGFDS